MIELALDTSVESALAGKSKKNRGNSETKSATMPRAPRHERSSSQVPFDVNDNQRTRVNHPGQTQTAYAIPTTPLRDVSAHRNRPPPENIKSQSMSDQAPGESKKGVDDASGRNN